MVRITQRTEEKQLTSTDSSAASGTAASGASGRTRITKRATAQDSQPTAQKAPAVTMPKWTDVAAQWQKDYNADDFDLLKQAAEEVADTGEDVSISRGGGFRSGEGRDSYFKLADQSEAEQTTLQQQLNQLKSRKSELEAGLDLSGAAELQPEIDRLSKLTKYAGETYEDNFGGQFMASMGSGRLSQEEAFAWNRYVTDPTEENREKAEETSKVLELFQGINAKALDDDATLPWISQSAAGYLPQFWDQTKARVGGGLAGAALGALATGGAGTTVGWNLGGAAASAAQMYGQTQGAAFKNLLDLGVDEELARTAVQDEAVVSSIIEFGDTLIDNALLGTNKVLDAVTHGAFSGLVKKGGEQAAKSAAAKIITALAKYGINIAGEGTEELLQEGVSIANENRVMQGDDSGIIGLARDAAGVVWKDALKGQNPENQDRMWQAAAEGAKIAAMFGGAQTAVNYGMSSYLGGQTATQRQTADSAIDQAYDSMLRNGMFSPEAERARAEAAAAVKQDGDTLLRQAAEQIAQEGKVSNRTAERILADQNSMELLGVEIDPVQSKAQKRAAVKSAVEAFVSREGGVSRAAEEVTRTTAQASQSGAQTAQAQSTAAQAHNIRAVRDAAQVMGEQGAKAAAEFYDGEMSPERYYGGFAAYYQAGVSGTDMGKVRSLYPDALNDAQKQAAYLAGQNDAAASLAEEKRAAQYAKVAGADSGLVFDDYVRDVLDTAVADRVNSVAKALGVRVQFVDSIRGGTANAQVNGSDILVEKNNRNPVLFLLGHEWTHRIQELAPTEYRAFRDAIAEGVQGEVEVLLEQYRDAGEDISYEAALDEAAANYAGRMIEDGKMLDDFIEKHQDNRTLLEKARDAIRDLVHKLTGAEKKLAQIAEEKLTAALEAAAKQASALQSGESGDTMGTARNSLKEDLENGRTREESREDFKRRSTAEGYSVYEGEVVAYGYRNVRGRSAQRNARQVQEEVKKLGIDAEIIDGPLLWNRDGITGTREVRQAVTVDRARIFINNAATIPPRNMAGHEAFHLWKSGAGRDAYIETVEDNLLFASDTFREYQSAIAEAHLGGEADLSDIKQEAILTEELFAYISGDIHEGVNDEYLRPMFRDFDAVKAAWEELVGKNREERRYSLKGSENARDIAAIRKENYLLRERVEYWKGQTRRTKRVTTDKKAVTNAARELIRSYGADLTVDDISGDLQGLYDYIASGYDGADELTYTEARRRAEAIAQTLVESAVAVDDEQYRQYADLRKYLRTTKLTLSEADSHDIADYGDLRKRQMGRMNLSKGNTNIDQVYQELSEMWPEFFDAQRESTPTDQLLHIAEVLDGIYDITEYNPFSHYMEQAVTGAANEIMEQFFDFPQAKATFADRQAMKLQEAKAKGQQQVQKVREQSNAKLAELREQNRRRVQDAIAKERSRRDTQIGQLKDRYAAKDAASRERRSAAELRRKITRHANSLSQKLLRPTDSQHIPENLRGAVAAMLESINQESQYTVDPKTGKRRKGDDGLPTKRTEAFRALKEQYAKIIAEGGDLVIDPSLLGSDAEGIQGSFDAVIAMKDTRLADMTTTQLETVWRVVKAVEHSISTAGKVLSQGKYAQTQDWARAMEADTATRRAKRSLTRSHAMIDLETPYTFFSHYGDAGHAVYRTLRNAQDQQQLMVDRVAEEVRKIADPKTVKALEEATHTFTTERGEKLTLSTAQIMELYELMKRKQAQDHLLKGGVVQPEIKSAKIRRGTDAILLTAGDLETLTGKLTDKQVKIADGLQKLTTSLLADYGNQASMTAYGYKKFTGTDYWPIKSAKEGIHSTVEKGGNNTRSIKNIGLAKSTMPHANNPLDIAGIFSTFSAHAADMTDYAAWLCTMEDLNRLYNFRFRDEDGNLTGKTIKGILDRVGGAGAQKYWNNLMEDIQNGINAPSDSPSWDIIGRGIGSFKGAAVGANLRVVIQQPTAFFRAGAVLSPADLSRGLARGATKGNGWAKALQYSPIAMRKDMGGFDIGSPMQMSEILFDNRSRVRKLNDALSAPAGVADAVTWGRLWNACEWATAREHSELTRGSEAFYKATNELFTEVIDQTQVVDGVLQRSNIMRSSNEVVKQATSFMGEPIMSLNLLMRSYDQVRYEQNAKKRGRAIKVMGRAATALVVTNVVNALAQSLVDAMRDDDEDKKYWDRFRAAFTGITGEEESAWDKAVAAVFNGNVGSNMNLLGQIPFVKDALSMLQGYNVSRTEMEIISDLIEAGQTAAQSAGGGGKKTRAYAVKALLAAGAKVFGIPLGNLTRDMWGLARSITVETDNIPLQYEMEKAIYNISNSGNKARYYDILYRALEQGDMDSYQHIRKELMNAMGLDGASIDSAMRSRYNKALEADPSYTLNQKARDLIGSWDKYAENQEVPGSFGADDLDASAYQTYAEQRASDYRAMADSLEANAIFLRMSDEERDKVLDAAYSLADKTALENASDGEYEITTGWMTKADDAEQEDIEPWEYVLFHVAYSMAESTKDADGKTIKGESKSDHVREWLEDFRGLTDAQREFLWGTVYTSEW